MDEPLPSNPAGGMMLIVGATDLRYYPLPSVAFRDAAEHDQISVARRVVRYETKGD